MFSEKVFMVYSATYFGLFKSHYQALA